MSKISEYIGSQFGNPRGIVGFIFCKCMNIINKKMYKKTVSLLTLDKNQKLLDIGLSRTKMAEKGFKKFEPAELVELGKQAGFENIEVTEIVKGKSFAVVYRK